MSGSGLGAGAAAGARAAFGIKLVLSREARPDELTRLVALYERERRHYQERTSAAAMVVGRDGDLGTDEADLAAWTIVANVLLNLDETVTKQ